MTLKRFERLLSAYGADIERWPVAERAAARALLAGSAEAASAQRVAAWLDKALHQSTPVVSGDSVARVLAAVDRRASQSRAAAGATLHRRAGRWAPTALLGGMAMLGFIVGFAEVETETPSRSAIELIGGVFSSDPAAGLGW